MRTIRLAIILLCGICLQMGASTIDSLRQVVPTLKGNERSKAYMKLSQLLSSEENPQAALDCLDEWIAFEQGEHNIEGEGKARWSKVAVLTNCAMDSMLLKEAPEQMAWFKKHRQWNRYYDTWDSKACVYMYSSRIQTALREAQDMLADAQKNDDNFGKAAAYQLMGVVYESMGQYDQAVDVFRECIKQLKQRESEVEAFTTVFDYLCQTLDESHRYTEELDVANEWEQEEAEQEICKAEEMQKACGTPLGQYRIYYVRVHYALAAKQAEQVLAYCDSLEALDLNAGGDVAAFRGEAYLQMGLMDEAAKTFRDLYYQKDSVFNREMRIQLDELNTLYKVDELKMQTQLERSRFLIGMAVALVVALLLAMYLRHVAAAKLRREHALLKVANARAEESSKMKTNFIQQISHEIRTPLNVLSGFTQIITAPDVKLDEATKNDINTRIIESTDRITGLVNKMLELSDANSTAVIESHDDVSAPQIASQAAEEARMQQARHITFEMQVAPDVLLLDNARKFTKQGSVRLILEKTDKMMRFVVEDTGIGVPAAEAEHIFEEFVQLDNYYDGTGIGLTVSRSIARRLGGDVELDTTYQSGARFVLTLPL